MQCNAKNETFSLECIEYTPVLWTELDRLDCRAGRLNRDKEPSRENRGFFRLSDDLQLTRGSLIPDLGNRQTCNRQRFLMTVLLPSPRFHC